MIKTFKCKETEKIWNELFAKKFPKNIQEKALQKLIMLNRAKNIGDLKNPPSNRLHVLGSDRKGQFSISIDMKWRICFIWEDNNAFDVEVVDYH